MPGRIGLIQTHGIGDIIIALPIADHFLEQGCEVVWPIDEKFVGFFTEIKPEVKFVGVAAGDGYFVDTPRALCKQAGCDPVFILYSYLTHQKVYDERLARSLKFDEYKYAAAGVPFARKWELKIRRNLEREAALHRQLQIKKEYICVHTKGSGFSAELTLSQEWQNRYQIIEVGEITDSPFDWIGTFERAAKLVFIDSCFSNLVEQLNIPVEKYLILRSPVAFTPVLKNGWKYSFGEQKSSVSNAAAGPAQWRDEAYQRYQKGQTAAAAELCRRILAQEPEHAEAIYLLGVIAHDAGQSAQAGERFARAAKLAPTNHVFRNAEGEACLAQGRVAEAIACFRQAIAARPTYERAHNSLGRALQTQGDLPAAVEAYNEALRLRPEYATAHNNLGAALLMQRRTIEAAEHFRAALRLQKEYPEAHFNLGSALQSLGDPTGAREHFQSAIQLRHDYPRAHHGLGQALEALADYHAALASYGEALRLKGDFAECWESLGSLLLLKPDWEGARTAFERALEFDPKNAEVFSKLVFTRQMLCDWRTRDSDVARLLADANRNIAQAKPAPIIPFYALTLPWSAAEQLAVARSHSAAISRRALSSDESAVPRIASAPRTDGARLRIGYLSCEFRDHAVSHLMQNVLAAHDRARFEVFAYSFGPDDGSVYRQRIARDCEHFHDLRRASTAESYRRICNDALDILVDLQGFTGFSRMSLLALRPAPIQVNYLGFAGSTGADFIDYLIGDAIVTPPEHAAQYSEELIILPGSFLPIDTSQSPSNNSGTRADHGLPENGAVFCAFNNSYKIEPGIFDLWMRILKQTPGSVLWLSPVTAPIDRNLREQAQARGVDGQRLVFARKVPDKADHLARHQLADLFLDTLIYNGHTTVADALWAGLPVLTCPGETFASRVGASLLTAAGLPELIAPDVTAYERTAIGLANSPDDLRRLKDALLSSRRASPLFDMARFTKNIERAYADMRQLHASGKPPARIIVD